MHLHVIFSNFLYGNHGYSIHTICSVGIVLPCVKTKGLYSKVFMEVGVTVCCIYATTAFSVYTIFVTYKRQRRLIG